LGMLMSGVYGHGECWVRIGKLVFVQIQRRLTVKNDDPIVCRTVVYGKSLKTFVEVDQRIWDPEVGISDFKGRQLMDMKNGVLSRRRMLEGSKRKVCRQIALFGAASQTGSN
jgi:hypothetical protein